METPFHRDTAASGGGNDDDATKAAYDAITQHLEQWASPQVATTGWKDVSSRRGMEDDDEPVKPSYERNMMANEHDGEEVDQLRVTRVGASSWTPKRPIVERTATPIMSNSSKKKPPNSNSSSNN
jgi:hypothetical protein